MKKTLTYLVLLILAAACNNKPSGQISIKSATAVKLNQLDLKENGDGQYIYNRQPDFPNIYTLSSNDHEWEIYWEVDRSLQVTIEKDSLFFEGDLIAENQYLLSEKKLNDEVSSFLGKNWYNIHIKDESKFIKTIDSVKNLYFAKMAATKNISSTFRELNKAAVHFAFDRMILRYPSFHKNFTGTEISIPKEALTDIPEKLNNPKHAELSSYKKYVRSWLDLEVQKKLINQKPDTVYKGFARTKTILEIVSNTFDNQKIKDKWSFELIKSHIEQYTWINGKQFLKSFQASCSTEAIRDSAANFESGILKKREELETAIYKTAKGQDLEVHIYRPDNFDSSKKYAALAAFHGGGWMVGDAFFTTESAQHAAEYGIIGFSVEYRLSNRDDITPSEAMEDTRDFIRWLRKNADSLSIDPEKIIAKGLSAGGHLVSSVSVIQEDLISIPNALILISPALDTQDNYFKSLLRKEDDPSDFSPIENLKSNLNIPKTLVLQGKTDNLTPTRYTKLFDSKMKELGYESELVIYEGCGHLFTPSNLDDTGWPQPDPDITERAFKKQVEFYRELGYSEI